MIGSARPSLQETSRMDKNAALVMIDPLSEWLHGDMGMTEEQAAAVKAAEQKIQQILLELTVTCGCQLAHVAVDTHMKVDLHVEIELEIDDD
jgi:adenosyl cobinamide kinase/adenosyl cobinamide phosphate guanylyltransferase